MTSRRERGLRWGAIALLAGAWALSAWATSLALSTLGTPFPSYLVDPHGQFSVVYLPGWGAGELGLERRDRLVAVEGAPVTLPSRWSRLPALQLREEAARAGGERLTVTFERDGARRELTAPLRRLGTGELWLFFGLNLLVAWGLLISGAWVAFASGRRGKWAYVGWSVASGLFLISFYDFHTTVRLAPLFTVCTVAVPLGFLWLAFAFPEPLPSDAGRLLPRLLTALGGAIALVLLLGPALAVEVGAVRAAVDLGVPLSVLALTVSILTRWARSEGREKSELRSAAWGLLFVPAFLGAGILINVFAGLDVVHLLMPFAVLLIPLSIGNALVKHNILALRDVLSPRVLLVPVGLLAVIAAGSTATLLSLVTPSTSLAWAGAAGAFLVAGGLAWASGTRIAFPTRPSFRPAVRQLGADLATLSDAELLQSAIEEAARRSVPGAQVRMLGVAELEQLAGHASEERARLERGERTWTAGSAWERRLWVPLSSLGTLRKVLEVGPRPQGAPYTDDDLVHLETIANLGAVALHHAEVLEELRSLRRLQEVVARDDKRLSLATIAAELSHEMTYPVNYFRHLISRAADGGAFDPEEVEVGREELTRLERMLSSFRGMRWPGRAEDQIPLERPVQRAIALLQEPLRARQIALKVELLPGAVVCGEEDGLIQVVANLLRNAIEASPEGGEVGIEARLAGDQLLVIVSDRGPGVPPEVEGRLFAPWATSKPQGTGMGLAVTHRLVRSFGGSVSYLRLDGLTEFRISLRTTRPTS